VALLTSDNNGVIMIEEGELVSNGIRLVPYYTAAFNSQTSDRLPAKMERTFVRNGQSLLQSITKRMRNGANRHIGKHYTRLQHFEYL